MSDASTSAALCPRCGRPVSATAGHGLCRACLAARLLIPLDQRTDARGLASPPRQIGDYELLEEIGRGGMGVVWRARQISLGRIVALKLLLAGTFASEEARHRFRREAHTISRLHHPSIVAIHEIAEHGGQLCFSMDLIQGRNLSARLREAPPTPRQAVEWLLVLAEAISHAHSRGVIHRDLKPANILIDELDAPHLTDFGLAKELNSGSDLTLTGQALGSASYMAPEQAQGRNAELTAATDIYSLGAILYHLLTGRPPFLADSLTATLKEVVDTDPVSPRKLNPGIPADLETICLKCLEKQPAHRYATAQALAEELRRWLEHKPIEARPATLLEKSLKWCRRNPVVAGLTTLLGVALLGGLLATLWQLHRAEHFLNTSQDANQRLTETLARREQREAEAQFTGHLYPEAMMTLARLVHENPSNTLARARLFSALTGINLPWPTLPALRHAAEVQYGAFAPDNSFILTASRDGLLHVWDAPSAKRRFTLPHDTARGGFALAPDGSRVATLNANGAAAVWQLPDGPRLFEIKHPAPNSSASNSGSSLSASQHGITAVALHPNGSLLATAGADGRACLWRMSDGQLEAAFEHGEPLERVIFQPQKQGLLSVGGTSCRLWDISTRSTIPSVVIRPTARPIWVEFNSKGDQLLTVSGRNIDLWNVATGDKLQTFQDRRELSAATFSPDGKWVVGASKNRNVVAYPLDANLKERTYRHNRPVNSVRFRPADTLFLTANDDATARLWSMATDGPRIEPMRHSAPVHDALFDAGGSKVLTLSADRTARVWYVLRQPKALTALPISPAATRLELSRDGELIAAAGPDGRLTVFASRDPRARRLEAVHSAAITAIALDAGARRLASGDETGQVLLSDVKTGRRFGEVLHHPAPVRNLRWCSNLLAVVTTTNVTIWKVQNGPLEPPVHLAMPRVKVLDFSPDGSRLVVAGNKPFAELHDSRTGKLLGSALEHPGEVQHARFSPDGKLLATGGGGKALRVWDAATGRVVTPFIRTGADVTWLAFSPDSQTLLTGGADGAIGLWNPRSGNGRRDFLSFRRSIVSAEFSPDGNYIVISDDDRMVHVYHLDSALPVLQPVQFSSPSLVRFSSNGRRLCVTTAEPSVSLIKMPTVAAPQADLLLAMTELVLGKRFKEHGSWEDLDTEEFFARQRALNDAKWRLGPDPQIRLYR